MLRIETTTNDVSCFKHHRKVEHREGPPTRDELLSRNGDKWLPVAPLDTLGT